VRLYHGASAADDRAIAELCEELNATETVFPRTNLRLVIQLGSASIPRQSGHLTFVYGDSAPDFGQPRQRSRRTRDKGGADLEACCGREIRDANKLMI
jgi:hypothetical protein